MKIIVVSGGFDPIHSGHIEYLKSAKCCGDKLIVALTSTVLLSYFSWKFIEKPFRYRFKYNFSKTLCFKMNYCPKFKKTVILITSTSLLYCKIQHFAIHA